MGEDGEGGRVSLPKLQTLKPPMPLTFDLESGVRVTCDMGYLCVNFSLPRPLCSRVRPDVCDRQTDVRQKHRLMHLPYGGRGIISIITST